MRANNERMEAQLLLGKGYLNQEHLPSDDFVSVLLNYDNVPSTMEIVFLYAIPLNF